MTEDLGSECLWVYVRERGREKPRELSGPRLAG